MIRYRIYVNLCRVYITVQFILKIIENPFSAVPSKSDVPKLMDFSELFTTSSTIK
jgi:hypothetical protein